MPLNTEMKKLWKLSADRAIMKKHDEIKQIYGK